MSFAKEAEMTKEQVLKCNAIIHTAAAAAGSASFFTAQIPLADSALIVPAQMAMVVGLAGVFGYKVTEGVAEAIVGPFISQQIGKAVAKQLVGFIPVAGNIVKATISVTFTETLGWLIAQKFCEGRARNLDAEDALNVVGDAIKNHNFKKKVSKHHSRHHK